MNVRWKSGDVFLVPNSDGKFTPGQIIALERRTLLSASCAFFDQRIETVDMGRNVILDPARCFSALLVTPDGLDAGVWPVVGNQKIVLPQKHWPYEHLLSKGKRGARITGSGIVVEFLNAFYGLRTWDGWYVPDFLDGMLLSAEKKPKDLLYSNGERH